MTDDAAARVAEQIIHSLPTTESLCVADYKESKYQTINNINYENKKIETH